MSREKRLSYSPEAEQAVLGALLLSNDSFDQVSDRIVAGDFWNAAHATIYETIARLLTTGQRADAITLAEALQRDSLLDHVGGLPYIGALVQATPSAASARHYAGIVRDRRLERDLHIAGGELMELAFDSGPIAERLDRAQGLVLALTETAVAREAVKIADLLPGMIESLEARHNSGETVHGLSTGLVDLDAKLGGLKAGQFIVVAGRPGMGKSVLAGVIGDAVSGAGKPVTIFSLEMSAEELVDRHVIRAGRVDGERFRTGRLGQDDFSRVSSGMARLMSAPLFIDDTSDATIARLRAKARRIKRKHGLDLLVVDYLQLMSARGDSRREEVDAISRGLKLLAKELGIPLIAVAQLSRKCEERTNKRPMLSDLRESGAIEMDADVVLFLYRDEVYNEGSDHKGIIEIDVAKQRNGPTGRVFCAYLAEHFAIENLDRSSLPAVNRPKPKPTTLMGKWEKGAAA